MGWIGCVCCQKFRCDFVERTFALVRPILHRVSCGNQTVPNSPKWYKTHKNVSLGSNGVDLCVRCEKFRRDFMAWPFSLVRPVLHRVSSSNKTLPNAPKYNETHQNMSLGTNGVGRVHSLRKIPKQLHGINLCINYISSARFAPSFVQ